MVDGPRLVERAEPGGARVTEGLGGARDPATAVALGLAEGLQTAGAPTWRVEAAVARVGRALGLPLGCLSGPTGIWVVGPEGGGYGDGALGACA